MNKLLPFILFGIGGVILPTKATETSSPSRIIIDEDVVIYAASANSGGKGVYTLPTSGTFDPQKISGSTYIQYYFQDGGGTFTSTESLYGTCNTGYVIYAIKATAQGGEDGPWSHTFMKSKDASNNDLTYEVVASDMAYDEVGKKIYGWFAADNYGYNYRFGEYDGENCKVIPIGNDVRTNITALAFDAKGTLWGIEGGTGKIYTINKADGSLTEKGSLGISASFKGQSAAIDPVSGKMYWGAIANAMSASLYEVDLEAFTATKVYDFPMGKRYNAFYIPGPATKKGAPAEITDLSAVFTGTGNDVKVSFTAPSKTFGGNDLTGELTYTVRIDDTIPETDGTGKINAGEAFEKTYSLTQGNHTVAVVVGNAVGDAPSASTQVYSGFDTPGAVTDLTATAEGANVAISWGEPAGQHGGLVDISGISYRVVRNPGAVVVAENSTEYSTSDILPEGHIKEYKYTVTVLSGEQEGMSATSEGITYGSPYTIPYSQDFENIGSFAEGGFIATAVNNAAGQTWKIGEMNGNKCAEVEGTINTKHDYALFTAPVKLTAGTEYTLKFGLAISAAYYSTGIRVFLSKEQNMTDENVITPYIAPNISQSAWSQDQTNKLKEYSYTFTVEEDGTYSVGFYDFASDRSGSYSIYIDNIEITGKLPVPEAPTELAANPIETGSRTIELIFKLPSKDVNGADLETISKAEIICGNAVLGTFESNFDESAFVPGEYATCRIEEAPRGYKAYKAVVYNGDYASEPSVTAAAFAGHINNIKIVDVKFPTEIPYDGKGTAEVTVMNDGFEEIFVYNVDIVADDRAVDSAEGVALKSDETHTYSFDIYWDSYGPRTRTFGAAVVYDDDDPTDNASKDFTVEFENHDVGIDQTDADQIKISAADGVLSISGVSHVEVFSANGVKVASTYVNGHWSISLPKGVYIVKTESYIHKTTV